MEEDANSEDNAEKYTWWKNTKITWKEGVAWGGTARRCIGQRKKERWILKKKEKRWKTKKKIEKDNEELKCGLCKTTVPHWQQHIKKC